MKLTVHERHIWWMHQHARCYPRWRKYSGGFIFYIRPNAWVEAVSPMLDGKWTTGRKSEGTEHVFENLADAITYAELLHNRREFAELKARFNPEYIAELGEQVTPFSFPSSDVSNIWLHG